MRSKEEILQDKFSDIGTIYFKGKIFEAMDEYASEVLRDELIKYTIWHQDKMFGCHALKEAIEHGVDEYLKTK